MCERPGARNRHLAGLRLRQRNEVGHALQRRVGVDDEELGRLAQIADRLEARERIEVELAHVRIDENRRRTEKQRVAVRRGPGDDVGADHGARARPVLDHEGRALGAVDLLGHEARDDVGRSSGRIGIDELDGARLRQRALRRHRERDGRREAYERRTGGDTPHIPNDHRELLRRCRKPPLQPSGRPAP
jgi:hypothetical protein